MAKKNHLFDNKRKPNHQERSIKLTYHSRMRLIQRLGTYGQHNSWEHLVKSARYKGTDIRELECQPGWTKVPEFQFYNKSRKIVYYQGWFYVFGGNNRHARTLLTVFRPDWLKHLSEDDAEAKNILQEIGENP